MRINLREVIKMVTVRGEFRELQASVEYTVSTWLEEYEHGSEISHREHSDFCIQDIEYITEDLSAQEKQQLDDEIHKGPYE